MVLNSCSLLLSLKFSIFFTYKIGVLVVSASEDYYESKMSI